MVAIGLIALFLVAVLAINFVEFGRVD